jgi:hypothetical protein
MISFAQTTYGAKRAPLSFATLFGVTTLADPSLGCTTCFARAADLARTPLSASREGGGINPIPRRLSNRRVSEPNCPTPPYFSRLDLNL